MKEGEKPKGTTVRSNDNVDKQHRECNGPRISGTSVLCFRLVLSTRARSLALPIHILDSSRLHHHLVLHLFTS